MQEVSFNNLYMMLSSLASENNPMWGMQKYLIALQEGQANYPLPVGTIDVYDANIRQTTRLEGTYTSSAGGSADFAFDDDYVTSCTQVSTAGNIMITFSEDQVVGVVGLMTNGDLDGEVVFEYSVDGGVTWQTALAPGTQEYTDRIWKWYDIDPLAFNCDAFRVRAATGVTLDIREFYVGNNPSVIPLGRINRDDYMSYPNKQFQGRPLQYWCDQQRDVPIMRVWPATDEGSRNQQFEVMLKRYLMDPGTLRDTLDVPQKWSEAIIWNLAWRVGVGLPEDVVDMAHIMQVVKPLAEQSWALIAAQESDNSPIRWAPNLHPYTA